MKLVKLPKITFSKGINIVNQTYYKIYIDGVKVDMAVLIDIVKIGLDQQWISYSMLENAYLRLMNQLNIADPSNRNYIASEIIKFIKSILPP